MRFAPEGDSVGNRSARASGVDDPFGRPPRARDVSRHRSQLQFREGARDVDSGMPAKGGVHDGVAATRAGERRRGDQFVDHRPARTPRRETGGEEDAIRGHGRVRTELEFKAVFPRDEPIDFALVPFEPVASNRTAEGASDVRGHRASVACFGDDGPTPVAVGLAAEVPGVLRTEPSRIAVELMLS